MQPEKDWLKASLGPNAEYYLARFAAIDAHGAWRPTWHWPAFFFSSAWFWYRRMPGFTFLNAMLFWAVLVVVLGRGLVPKLCAGGLVLGLYALVPMYANALYYRRMKKRFAETQEKPADPRAALVPTASVGASVAGALLASGFVFAGILVWSSQYMYADYTVRSRVTELVNVAGVCRTSVREFYQANGRMPSDAHEAKCLDTGTANSAAPRVNAGVIRVEAAGKLRTQLGEEESGVELRLTPVCEGPCTGKPIVSWDCRTGTNIEPKFLPAICR
jgi:type IV pilus assembly protein PilA